MVVVLGGGIAGLAAANYFELNAQDYILFEAKDQLGGLLKRFKIGSFTFDHCVHLAFGDHQELNKIIEAVPYFKREGRPMCFDDGLRLPHPLQHNIYHLNTDEKIRIITSFLEKNDQEVNNYHDWLINQYGSYFAQKYPIRYNKKYWDMCVKDLSTEWIGNRMTRPDFKSVLYGAFEEKNENYYYAPKMKYPKRGGFYSFVEPLTKIKNICLNKEAISINLEEKTITFSDGDITKYEKIINTIPLPILLNKIVDLPEALRKILFNLQWTSVHLVSFGLNCKLRYDDIWQYIYDEDILASRVYSPSLKSPFNAPPNHSSLQFEIYTNSRNNILINKERLIQNCEYALAKMKLANTKEIVFSDVRTVEFGNIVFNHKTLSSRRKILDWLRKHDIYGAGRFGKWDYLWSHQAFQSGWETAETVLHDEK